MSAQGGLPIGHGPAFSGSVKWIGKLATGRTTGGPPKVGVSVICESNTPEERTLNVLLIVLLSCRKSTLATGPLLVMRAAAGGAIAGENRISTRLRSAGSVQLPQLIALVETDVHPLP